MKITHIELKNWGPHEHLDVDMDASVVGVIGPNGHGKSNFLQAIDFGLNGNLNKQNKEEYIRNFGQKNGATKASVVIEFVKNGQKGKITRTITKTQTTRLLEWDGNKYKSDADVSSMMLAILGADKAAMANAIFVKQGDLDKIVKGTPAVRQDVFMKLMNLAFIDAREHELLNKINKLKAGLVDYGPVLDNLKLQEESVISRLDILKKNVSKDRSTEIKQYEEYLTALNSVNSAWSAVTDARASLIDATQRFESALNTDVLPLGYENVESLQYVCDSNLTKLNKEKVELVKAQDAVKWADVYYNTIAELSKQYELFSETSAKLKGLKHVQVLKAEEKKILESKTQVTVIENLKEEIRTLETEIAAAKEELANAEKARALAENEKKEKVPVYEKQILEYMESKGRETMKYKFFSNNDASTTCPICDSPLPVIADKKSFLIKLEAEINNIQNFIDEATANIEDLNAAVNKTKIKESMAITKKKTKDSQHNLTLNKLVEALSANRVADSIAELDKMYNEVHVMLEEAMATQSTMDKVNVSISELNSKKASILKSYDEDTLYSAKEKVETLVKSIEAKQEIIDKQQNILTVMNSIKLSVTKAESAFNNAKEFYDRENEKLTKLNSKLSGKSAEEVSKTKDLLVEAQSQYVSNMAMISQAEENLKELTAQIADVKSKISIDKERRNLIDDLNILRGVISKNGLPLQYMNFVFERLTVMVQSILSDMGANFYVVIDPENPITYRFVRNDNGDGYEMPQERLSGGQAIRLALALLIACQQVILPEVGLLVLDEPSSHVDADGVVSLKDMFCNMASVFQNSESQLIVVDHNSVLETAFEKTLKL